MMDPNIVTAGSVVRRFFKAKAKVEETEAAAVLCRAAHSVDRRRRAYLWLEARPIVRQEPLDRHCHDPMSLARERALPIASAGVIPHGLLLQTGVL